MLVRNVLASLFCPLSAAARWRPTGRGTARHRVSRIAVLSASVLTVVAAFGSHVHAQIATIYNAWWTNQQDLDGDGCQARVAV